MAALPGVGNESTVGVLIATTADDGAIKTTQAELTILGDTAAKAGNTAASAFDTFTKNLKSVGQQMTETGRSMTTAFTLPIVGVAAASTAMAMKFQQSMELLHTNAGVAQSAVSGLSDQILALAPQVGQGPDALATAFYHIATAGQGIFTTAQQLDQLKVAAEGAAIGQASLDDTTYALTSTLAANVKGATDYNQTMGTLLGIVQAGDMHLSDLNEVIGTGLMGTLSTFGVSLQSAGAALADFGDLGEKGAAAGTRLRMMLSLMASPSAAAAKILGDLGLTTGEVGTATDTMNSVFAKTGLTTTKLADDLRQPNGIFVAVSDLKTHLEDAGLSASQTDAILAKAFGGGRTDAALLQLLNTTDRLDLKYQQIGTDSGNFASNWQAQQQTMKQQWDEAWGGIQADMIKIGESIMPQVSKGMHDIAGAISDVTNWYGQLNPDQKQFVIDAAGILAISGPLLMFFGGVATGISNILSLGGTVGGGLFGKDGLFSKLGNLGGNIPGWLKGGGSMAADWASALSDMVKNSASAVSTFAQDAASTAADWAKSFASMMKDGASAALSFAGNALSSAGAWIKAAHDSELGVGGTIAKMINDWNLAASAAIKNAVLSSAAWVKGAAASAYAWVTVTLPNMIKEFGATAVTAGINALATSAAWVKNAVASSGAWILATAQMKSEQIAVGIAAVINGAIAGTQWVIAGIKAGAYAVALDAAKTSTYLLGSASLATGAIMAGVFAGMAADAYLVVKAVQAIQGAIEDLNKADQARVNAADQGAAIKDLEDKYKAGKITKTQETNAINALLKGVDSLYAQHATGANYARGGWSMVGENGPEAMYVPQGSMIKTAPQTTSLNTPGGRSVVIEQTNNNYSMFDLTQANRELAWRLSNAI